LGGILEVMSSRIGAQAARLLVRGRLGRESRERGGQAARGPAGQRPALLDGRRASLLRMTSQADVIKLRPL